MSKELIDIEIKALKEARNAVSVRMRHVQNIPLSKGNRAYIRDAIDGLIIKCELRKKEHDRRRDHGHSHAGDTTLA